MTFPSHRKFFKYYTIAQKQINIQMDYFAFLFFFFIFYYSITSFFIFKLLSLLSLSSLDIVFIVVVVFWHSLLIVKSIYKCTAYDGLKEMSTKKNKNEYNKRKKAHHRSTYTKHSRIIIVLNLTLDLRHHSSQSFFFVALILS